MGDSYAAGIGSGKHITTGGNGDKFCFRFDEAYGPLLQDSLATNALNLSVNAPTFNFVACSGETFSKILANQFLDKPKGVLLRREALFGKPQFVTINLGGNDIGFKELVTRCIYGIWVFTPGKTCDDVIKSSQDKVKSADFKKGIAEVIDKAIAKGTATVGGSFKVFVLGYAQFFNDRTEQCNNKQLLTPAYLLPHAHGTLTIELRQTLNQLARDLNEAIQTAIMGVSNPAQVIYVDYDRAFESHRFCDRPEPNPTDPDTWFITFPVKEEEEQANRDFLLGIPRIRDLKDDPSSKPVTEDEFIQLIGEASGDDNKRLQIGIDTVSVFHPTPMGHRAIETILRAAVERAYGKPNILVSNINASLDAVSSRLTSGADPRFTGGATPRLTAGATPRLTGVEVS